MSVGAASEAVYGANTKCSKLSLYLHGMKGVGCKVDVGKVLKSPILGHGARASVIVDL
jgi:hypothetical protein